MKKHLDPTLTAALTLVAQAVFGQLVDIKSISSWLTGRLQSKYTLKNIKP